MTTERQQTFDRWLSAALERRDVQPSQLATAIGATPTAVRRWLSGGRPGGVSVSRVLAAIGADVDEEADAWRAFHRTVRLTIGGM